MRIDLGAHRLAQRDSSLSDCLQGAFSGSQTNDGSSDSSRSFVFVAAVICDTLQTLPASTSLCRKLLLILRNPVKHAILPSVRLAEPRSKQVQLTVVEKGLATKLLGDSGIRAAVRLHAVFDKQPSVPSQQRRAGKWNDAGGHIR